MRNDVIEEEKKSEQQIISQKSKGGSNLQESIQENNVLLKQVFCLQYQTSNTIELGNEDSNLNNGSKLNLGRVNLAGDNSSPKESKKEE